MTRQKELDFAVLSRELIRALRGRRSQPGLSRRLGLRSNLVYRWESGRAAPSAERLFQICRAVGRPPERALHGFFGAPLSSLHTREGVCGLLAVLRGDLGVVELAARVRRSRFVVARWLSGATAIRVPELLAFVQATSLRLLDFLSLLVDPSALPSAARAWSRLQAARIAAYDVPWSHAVLRALELEGLSQRPGEHAQLIAERLAIPRAEVARALELLARSGQIRRRGDRYRPRARDLVDTGMNPARKRELQRFWGEVALARLDRVPDNVAAFNLFTIAERDLEALRALHAEFFKRMRELIARSAPDERVVVYAAQIVALDRAQ